MQQESQTDNLVSDLIGKLMDKTAMETMETNKHNNIQKKFSDKTIIVIVEIIVQLIYIQMEQKQPLQQVHLAHLVQIL